jgi:hypothetical protein
MVVLSNVEPGQEDAFNEWYTGEHIIDVVEKLPGFVSAQRFELAPTQLEHTQYRYLAIYRIPEGRLEEGGERSRSADLSNAGDGASDSLSPYASRAPRWPG